MKTAVFECFLGRVCLLDFPAPSALFASCLCQFCEKCIICIVFASILRKVHYLLGVCVDFAKSALFASCSRAFSGKCNICACLRGFSRKCLICACLYIHTFAAETLKLKCFCVFSAPGGPKGRTWPKKGLNHYENGCFEHFLGGVFF